MRHGLAARAIRTGAGRFFTRRAAALFGWLAGGQFIKSGAEIFDLVLDHRLDSADILFVIERDQRIGLAQTSRAAGAADAVHIVFGMMGNVEVEDVAHFGNIEPACGDIGCHQQLRCAGTEGIQSHGSGALVHIAMQGRDVEAVARQRFVQIGDINFAVAENDGVFDLFLTDQGAQHIALGPILRLRSHQTLGDGGGGCRLPLDLDPRRIVQKGFGQALDFRRHGGREKQGLTGKRHQLADAFDIGNEAHIQHAVGFVDHQNFNAGQEQFAALEMVEQAARRGNQHIDAAGDLEILITKRHAADQQSHRQLLVCAIFGEIFFDLSRQFAGRLQNQRARHAGAGATLFQQGQHRQRESGRFAGACLGNAQNILAGQNLRDCLCLNGGGDGVTRRRYGFEYFWTESEFCKCHQ